MVCISNLDNKYVIYFNLSWLDWSLACLLYSVLSLEHPWLPHQQHFPNCFSSIMELPSLPLQCPQIPWQADPIIPRSLGQLLAFPDVAVPKARSSWKLCKEIPNSSHIFKLDFSFQNLDNFFLQWVCTSLKLQWSVLVFINFHFY